MNFICVTCTNPLGVDDCVFITNCGHIFHRHCLFNCMERTSTCPECNAICTATDVHRLYLAFASESSEQETVSNLNDVLSDLQQKLAKNSIDLKNLETDIANLKAKYTREKEQQIIDLKEQIQQRKNVQKKLFEAKSWESIHKVLTGSIKDVEEELNNVKSQRQLARMIVLLRRDIKTVEDKKKAFRVMLRESQLENVKLNSENRELLAKSDILQARNSNHRENLNSQITLGAVKSSQEHEKPKRKIK